MNPPSAGADKNPLAAVINGQDAGLMDLLEVRLELECNAVALAARRATEEDVRELEKCVQEMAVAVGEGNLGSDADITFHMAIAYATKNIVQIHIMKSLYDLLADARLPAPGLVIRSANLAAEELFWNQDSIQANGKNPGSGGEQEQIEGQSFP